MCIIMNIGFSHYLNSSNQNLKRFYIWFFYGNVILSNISLFKTSILLCYNTMKFQLINAFWRSRCYKDTCITLFKNMILNIERKRIWIHKRRFIYHLLSFTALPCFALLPHPVWPLVPVFTSMVYDIQFVSPSSTWLQLKSLKISTKIVFIILQTRTAICFFINNNLAWSSFE